jgi:endoglucanase
MGQAEALLDYRTLPGADRATCDRIVAAYAQSLPSPKFMPQEGGNELYRAWVPEPCYHWGSNRTRACHGLVALAGTDPALGGTLRGQLRQRALDMLHALHGVNPLNLVYLTNMSRCGAESSAARVYHEWFGDNPAPGYLAGGPNRDYSGDVAWIRQQPPAKAYAELNGHGAAHSWELTEPAIYYQATYIRLLAAFVARPGQSD